MTAHTVTELEAAVVCATGPTGVDALQSVVDELRANHPPNVLLSAVTVYLVEDGYDAEVTVRVENPIGSAL